MPVETFDGKTIPYGDGSFDVVMFVDVIHHADPPMTKDAVAGRIRRLLAMADKRAVELGVPGTEASLPADLDDV